MRCDESENCDKTESRSRNKQQFLPLRAKPRKSCCSVTVCDCQLAEICAGSLMKMHKKWESAIGIGPASQ